MRKVDCYFISRALTGIADECGDAGFMKIKDDQCFLALVDVLGHGKNAHGAACIATEYIERRSQDDLRSLMRDLHEHLKGTPGAVSAFCRVFLNNGDLTYVGIGNITVRVLGPRPFKFVPRDGVVGYMMPSPTEQFRRIAPNDVLVMYSDGIRENFDLLEYPDLLKGSAKEIAIGILEKFGKKDDDASCIAMRFV